MACVYRSGRITGNLEGCFRVADVSTGVVRSNDARCPYCHGAFGELGAPVQLPKRSLNTFELRSTLDFGGHHGFNGRGLLYLT